MNKLLDSLRELDPTTWRKLEEIKTAIRDAEEGWRVDGVEYYFGADIFPMIVQGAIQDAIRGRGWGCYQYHYRRDALEGDKKSEFAYISCTTLSHASADADTPAEAILAAYVAAMEVCNNAD